ncbi:MAG: hypothetical protein JO219_09855 [Candidatus Eremiobacteraeota bacterium]|nr:hypothetical protein [Candidatus Eremiobacteraeota bacterium]
MTIALGCAAPASAALRAVAFVSPTIGWIAGDGVIYGTNDGGHTWQQQYKGRYQIWSLSFVSSTTGFAAAVDPIPGVGALLTTHDGGRTWARAGEPRNPARQISFANTLKGFAMAGGSQLASSMPERVPAFFGGRLATTADSARSWRMLDSPLLVDTTCASDPTHVWAAYQAAVLRSDDGGDSFSNVLSPLIDTKRIWYATIECAGANVAWVQFAGAASGDQRPYVVFRTIDGGQSWAPVLANKKTTDAYPQLAATYGDVPGPWPGPFSVVDANSAFFLGACPQCGARGAISITATNDGGKTWQPISTVPDVTLAGPVAISFADAQHGWVVGSSSAGAPVVAATWDGGMTWSKQVIK